MREPQPLAPVPSSFSCFMPLAQEAVGARHQGGTSGPVSHPDSSSCHLKACEGCSPHRAHVPLGQWDQHWGFPGAGWGV